MRYCILCRESTHDEKTKVEVEQIYLCLQNEKLPWLCFKTYEVSVNILLSWPGRPDEFVKEIAQNVVQIIDQKSSRKNLMYLLLKSQ
jgi:late competence protein required for DNA uptake (superfamily II DNA/RNA helicase)